MGELENPKILLFLTKYKFKLHSRVRRRGTIITKSSA